MGTGSSKNNNVVAFDLENVPPAKKQNDQNGNKPSSWQEDVKKEQKSRSRLGAFFGQATVINPKVEKSRTRIVDFDSSSDEEKEEEDEGDNSKWREEVDNLQQTLNSLGLEEDRRQVRLSEVPVKEFFIGEQSSVSLQSSTWGQPAGTTWGPPGSATWGPQQDRLGSRRGRGRPPSRDIRFSWEDRMTQQEEWGVQKVNIDGFDPEKFRVANQQKAGQQRSSTDDSDIIISHKIPSLANRPAYPELVSMPGVPSYDPLEQQLLASLERELGVL